MSKVYDYIVIGSGFGGSVSAMRLSEKGYSVAVIEKGKRWQSKDFPNTNWKIRKYLWMPLLKCFGFMRMDFFEEVFILSGIGVGGGSLVYANTHMVPPDAFFNNPVWSHFKDWKSTLMPFYDKAKFMLGTTRVNKEYPEDEILKEIARDMGREDSYDVVNVGVYYGNTKEEKDPYFNGLGPNRKGCIECAGCMVGCRYNAKNTLDKNYLYFAEQFGAEVFPETLVTKIEHKDGLYHIHTQSSTSWFKKNVKVYQSKGLVVSAGVLGTMRLLLKQKYDLGTLPNLSDTLGNNVRTNSESLCGVLGANQSLNHGVAISSIFNPDDDTHIEIVKFPDESDLMTRLGGPSAGSGGPLVRTAKMIGNFVMHPIQYIKAAFSKSLAKGGIIIMAMQTLDNSMKMVWKKGLFGGKITFDNKGDNRVPAYIEVGQKVMQQYADKVEGVGMNALTEVTMNMSTTAHIMGGCPMGKDTTEGVVDEYFKVFGYPNMHILDGSIMPCNLGVNPSLTITTLSEYAMSHIPEKANNTQKTLEQLMAEQKG